MQPLTFIFLGRSGAGKGTQAELLRGVLKEKDPERTIFTLETGERFRNLNKAESFVGGLTKEVVETGGLSPTFVAVWAWATSFIENLKGGEHIFIDGSPRKLSEAEVLSEALIFFFFLKPIVIHLDVPIDFATKLLLGRGRTDDTDEGIARRQAWYEKEVVRSVHFFKEHPAFRYLKINGVQPIEAVHKEIKEALGW